MHCMALLCIAQYCCIAQCCSALHAAVLLCIAWRCSALHAAALLLCIACCCAALHCMLLLCIAWRCSALHGTALHCTVLCCCIAQCSSALHAAVLLCIAQCSSALHGAELLCSVPLHCSTQLHCNTASLCIAPRHPPASPCGTPLRCTALQPSRDVALQHRTAPLHARRPRDVTAPPRSSTIPQCPALPPPSHTARTAHAHAEEREPIRGRGPARRGRGQRV